VCRGKRETTWFGPSNSLALRGTWCSEDAVASPAQPATDSGWYWTADRYEAIKGVFFFFLNAVEERWIRSGRKGLWFAPCDGGGWSTPLRAIEGRPAIDEPLEQDRIFSDVNLEGVGGPTSGSLDDMGHRAGLG
jgi:hypothetical protein